MHNHAGDQADRTLVEGLGIINTRFRTYFAGSLEKTLQIQVLINSNTRILIIFNKEKGI